MDAEIGRIEEENTLESYLLPNPVATGLGAYSEGDLRHSLQSLQGRLRSMGVAPLGDLFRADAEAVRATLKCTTELVSRLVLGNDAKGNSNAKTLKLQNDLKLQSAQLEKVLAKKRAAEQEVASLSAKTKRLESELAERKKTFSTKQTEFENEKATWENKYKLFNNELKKKDNVIKKYSEISGTSAKEGNVVNNIEIVGEFTKPGGKYGTSEPYAEFMSFCQSSTREQFEALRKENDSMREQLAEMNQMMDDIVKVRKAVIEQKLVELDKPEEQGIIVQIRQELLNLKDTDMELSSLTTLRENMRRFKDFMEKVDSVGFNVPLGKSYQYEPETEIDEIKNLKRLKDLLSRDC